MPSLFLHFTCSLSNIIDYFVCERSVAEYGNLITKWEIASSHRTLLAMTLGEVS